MVASTASRDLAVAFAQVPMADTVIASEQVGGTEKNGGGEDRVAKRRRLENLLKTRTAAREDKFAEAIVVMVDSEYLEEIKAKDAERAHTHQVAAGRYFKVGMVDGSPVYRQEAPMSGDQVNNQELFLARFDNLKSEHKGWYLATDIGCDKIDDATFVAWLPSRPNEPQTFPQTAHIPYWSKKKTPAIFVCSYVEWLESQLGAGS